MSKENGKSNSAYVVDNFMAVAGSISAISLMAFLFVMYLWLGVDAYDEYKLYTSCMKSCDHEQHCLDFVLRDNLCDLQLNCDLEANFADMQIKTQVDNSCYLSDRPERVNIKMPTVYLERAIFRN